MLKFLIVSILLQPPQYSFDGDFTQGGLVVGNVSSWLDVYQDGTKLPNHNGKILFGFNRDAAPSTNITLKHNGEVLADLKFDVEQRQYDIQNIDGLPASKVNPPAMDWDRIKRENAQIGAVRLNTIAACPEVNFISPAEGEISGVYGSQRVLNGEPKRPHFGLDIAGTVGTKIISPAWGKVVLVADDMFYTGGTIAIDHGCGLVSIFSHLSEIDVNKGDELSQGDIIGKIGATGRATGPHLDWRVNLHKVRLDPALLLE